MKNTDIKLLPPQPKEENPYCTVCGQKLYWGDKVYLSGGQLLGCDNCIENRYAEDLDFLWR